MTGIVQLSELSLNGNKIGSQVLEVMLAGTRTIRFDKEFSGANRTFNGILGFKIANMLNTLTHDVTLSLKNFDRLQNLDISGNIMSPSAAKAFADFMSVQGFLEKLNLSGCLLLLVVVKVVLKALVKDSELKELNLSFCHLQAHNTHWPAAAVGRIIQIHPRL